MIDVPADLYDIEEVFGDDAGGAVRLPRRQAGGSPQGLTTTLLADYTLRGRAWLPSGAIVTLLTESGVSPAGARTAVSRLARRGVLEGRRHGRHSSYRLTGRAAAGLSAGGRWILGSMTAPDEWDGRWTLVAFSLPQEHGTRRRALRGRLRWLGCAPLYDGLWVCPHELAGPARDELALLDAGAVTVFRARRLDLPGPAGRDPLDAWDLAAIAGHYESFLHTWRPLLPRIAAGTVGGAEAVRARTEVMDTFRRFPLLDPRLPLRLLPPDWLREPATAVFTGVYDGLAGVAEAHVRAVAARLGTPGARSDVAAHTVADLLAGVLGGPSAEEGER